MSNNKKDETVHTVTDVKEPKKKFRFNKEKAAKIGVVSTAAVGFLILVTAAAKKRGYDEALDDVKDVEQLESDLKD